MHWQVGAACTKPGLMHNSHTCCAYSLAYADNQCYQSTICMAGPQGRSEVVQLSKCITPNRAANNHEIAQAISDGYVYSCAVDRVTLQSLQLTVRVILNLSCLCLELQRPQLLASTIVTISIESKAETLCHVLDMSLQQISTGPKLATCLN